MLKNNNSLGLLGKGLDLYERDIFITPVYLGITEEGKQVYSNPGSRFDFMSEVNKERIVRQNKFDIKRSAPNEDPLDNWSPNKIQSPQKSGEKSAFGSKATRFPPINHTGSPIASYNVKKVKSSIDFNVKGLGNGFISKNKRFGPSIHINTGPGPGQYSSVLSELQGKKFPKSTFPPKLSKSPRIRPLVQKDFKIGPGSYQLNESLVTKSNPNYESIFKSRTSRNVWFS